MTNWFGLDSIGGSDVTLGIAFVAGLVSFLTPCVLPIVPGYVSYLTGVSLSTTRPSRWRLLRHALAFVGGFLVVFVILGVGTGTIGQWLAIYKEWFRKLGGLFLFGLGLLLTEWVRWPWLYKTLRLSRPESINHAGVSWWHSVVTGFIFGFSWSPCIGPVLATIIFLATWQGGSMHGGLLLGAFALGLGIPFIATAVFMDRLLPWLKRFTQKIALLQKISGLIMMILGLLLVTGSYDLIQGYLIRFTNPLL